jgi:hypothetical protein
MIGGKSFSANTCVIILNYRNRLENAAAVDGTKRYEEADPDNASKIR